MSGPLLATIAAVGWLTLLLTLHALCRASAQRERAEMEALDRMRRAGL